MGRNIGYHYFITASLFLLTLAPFRAESMMSSSNYQIQWDSVGNGGSETSSSASYKLHDTIGVNQGIGSSSSYREDGGYRGGIYDPTVAFQVFSENTSTQVATTLLVSTTVTVTSTVDYSVGDYVAVVQDLGASQVSAIGKVTVVGGSTLTVDEFHDGGVAPTIDGSNDYVYKLSGTALPLGTFSSSVVTTGIVGWDSSADVSNGYSVFLYENHNPSDGGNTISDVGDGSVDAGSSEYGARSSDTSLASSTFDTQDTAITTSLQQVASRGDNSLKARDFVTLKVGVSATQAGGSYSQTLTFVFVGNY